MAKLSREKIGKNELLWLAEGPGSHGVEAPSSPTAVIKAAAGSFVFAQEDDGTPGLRSPQLGALHSILANRTIESSKPITVVMPTGTGKTETMLASFAHSPSLTLVVVPSDALRTQVSEKFATYGVLPAVGVVRGDFLCPVVGILRSGLATADECDGVLDRCNVLVATAASLSKSAPESLDRIASRCDRLYVDEAHHVAARTWREVADRFADRSTVFFTATPFREDGAPLGGRIVYAYPLTLAQERGYFASIDYRSVLDLGDPDRAVAEAATQRLREDLAAGLDHVLMARVRNTRRAAEVLDVYRRVAEDLAPLRLDSKLAKRDQVKAKDALLDRRTRAIVCVDMLGEGFDMPALKVAAIHDPHKSLAVTLQFVGRFARVGDETLGGASVFVPRQPSVLDDRLRRLYAEDSDWNHVIRDLTEVAVGQQQDRSDFEASFAALPTEIAMRSVQPKMSTVVYSANDLGWSPEAVYDLYGEDELLTEQIAINNTDHIVWFVTAERTPVRWGEFESFFETVHHLYVVHADLDAGLLYINSSNNDSVHKELAKAIGGEHASLIRGDVVYRVLHPIQRRVPTNVGLLDAVNRNRRFSMHVGADVLEGFGPNAAQKSKTNIFAHGYADGGRVSFGASRKGRIWSHRAARDIFEWTQWARSVGHYLTDESISIESVMDGFIIPEAATSRPDLVPLGVEWPYELLATTSEARQVSFDDVPVPLLDLDLAITEWSSEGPIRFEVSSDSWSIPYEMHFGEDGPFVVAAGRDGWVNVRRESVRLANFMTEQGLTVFFEKEAVLSPDGYLIQPDRERPRFDPGRLIDIDWTGVDLRSESQGTERRADTVQYRVIEHLRGEADWEVIVDDDGTGEIADVVCLRREQQALHLELVHCKYSHGDRPGSRVIDLYEVCGQAAKSHKARADAELVLQKLIRRERRRAVSGSSGLILGTGRELMDILAHVRLLDVRVTVTIAQPGLSKAGMSSAQAELLACTELYLSETYNSAMRVICSP